MNELLHVHYVWIVPLLVIAIALYTMWDFSETNRVFSIDLSRDAGSLLFETFMVVLLSSAGGLAGLMLVAMLNHW